MARQIVADVIAALMHQPRTQAELREFTGASLNSLSRVLYDLRECGVVYRSGSRPATVSEDGNRRGGSRPVVWSLQTKPFAEPDRVNRLGQELPLSARS